MGSDKARPAYVEDVDDDSGRPVRESRKSAAVKPKVVGYPEASAREREKRKTTKARKSQSDAAYALPAQLVEIPREKHAERRKSVSGSGNVKSPHKLSRTTSSRESHAILSKRDTQSPSSSSATDPRSFGIPTATASQTPLVLRPRAITANTYPRPLSVHAQTPSGSYGQGPPLSMSAYYQQPPLVAPSYPPPSVEASYMRCAARPQAQTQLQYVQPQPYQYAPAQHYPQQPPYTMSAQAQYATASPGEGYFAPKASSRPLAERFDPIKRSSTAFEPGTRTASALGGGRDARLRLAGDGDLAYHDDGYASAADGAAMRTSERRNSIRVPSATPTMSRAAADAIAMPPPSRLTGILRKPTENQADRSSDPGAGSYYEHDDRSEYRLEPRARRPSVGRHSMSYDVGGVRIESANSGRRRRKSVYAAPSSAGGSSDYDAKSTHESKSAHEPKSAYETKMSQAQSYQGATSSYDAKMNQAQSYQDDVAGPTIPLTAEVLRRQQRKQGGSSRGTKSSASRDESDYKKSATTRTTRSGSGDNEENVTIKVVGQARVVVGGAQIDCSDGGEIHVQRQKSLRNGSERSISEYDAGRIEDRKSRVSQPSGRPRVSRSRDSYTRTPEYPRQRERERDDPYF